MKREVPEGAKVKFFHRRLEEGEIPFLYAPRGGSTTCQLTLADGTEVTGEARCSPRDNYSKRIGRDIALGRALKAYAQQNGGKS